MAKYDPRQELMATQQSLLEGYEHQLNNKIKENVAILSHLSQHEHAGKQVPHQEMQQALKGDKKKIHPSWVHYKIYIRSCLA